MDARWGCPDASRGSEAASSVRGHLQHHAPETAPSTVGYVGVDDPTCPTEVSRAYLSTNPGPTQLVDHSRQARVRGVFCRL